MAAELTAGRTGLAEGVALYHMVLEGIIFDAAHHALRNDLADGALPGVREGVRRVELDERWHIGFGLRCLIETRPSAELLADLLPPVLAQGGAGVEQLGEVAAHGVGQLGSSGHNVPLWSNGGTANRVGPTARS